MDIEAARSFLTTHHRGILHTNRSSGAPQMSPIAAGVDSEGRVIISSRESAYKVRNLRRDPRASVCVFTDRWYGEWAQIDGRAEIVALPEAMELLVDYYRRLAGEHPDWDEYRRAMQDEQRVLIRITVDRVGPARSG